MRLGICDWGVGGIGLYKELKNKSGISIIYLSDSGYTPYGKVSQIALANRWLAIQYFFFHKGITHIAVACNALSTVVTDSPVHFSVIESGLETVNQIGTKTIGITGGIRTMESGVYKDPLTDAGIEVIQSIGQKLSAQVEIGDLNSNKTLDIINDVFTPLSTCNHVLLACTHYPVLASEINRLFPHINLHNPVPLMANKILATVNFQHTSDDLFYTTGAIENMRNACKKSFGLQLKKVEQIEI